MNIPNFPMTIPRIAQKGEEFSKSLIRTVNAQIAGAKSRGNVLLMDYISPSGKAIAVTRIIYLSDELLCMESEEGSIFLHYSSTVLRIGEVESGKDQDRVFLGFHVAPEE